MRLNEQQKAKMSALLTFMPNKLMIAMERFLWRDICPKKKKNAGSMNALFTLGKCVCVVEFFFVGAMLLDSTS